MSCWRPRAPGWRRAVRGRGCAALQRTPSTVTVLLWHPFHHQIQPATAKRPSKENFSIGGDRAVPAPPAPPHPPSPPHTQLALTTEPSASTSCAARMLSVVAPWTRASSPSPPCSPSPPMPTTGHTPSGVASLEGWVVDGWWMGGGWGVEGAQLLPTREHNTPSGIAPGLQGGGWGGGTAVVAARPAAAEGAGQEAPPGGGGGGTPPQQNTEGCRRRCPGAASPGPGAASQAQAIWSGAEASRPGAEATQARPRQAGQAHPPAHPPTHPNSAVSASTSAAWQPASTTAVLATGSTATLRMRPRWSRREPSTRVGLPCRG